MEHAFYFAFNVTITLNIKNTLDITVRCNLKNTLNITVILNIQITLNIKFTNYPYYNCYI